ncbi:hypothetical protein ACFPT7_01205 [Acidicapsa dinghuensis]|uniref:Tetratricopeptide repeat protein n=1 Tax=Acidicapsa dinghuensis TaxID=2218256 RepID=A0ABW1EAE3_9BACT|nr:hypothetical protein [Acidicapsa dinghuensis]
MPVHSHLRSLLTALCLLPFAASQTSHAVAPERSAPNASDGAEYRSLLQDTRIAYFKVVAGQGRDADNEAHTALSRLENAYPGDPIAKAYHGSLQLLDAAHSWAVWNLHQQCAEGLNLLDEAVNEAPDDPEVRFLRAATDWHLPAFYHRRAQAESDFSWLAARAETDARNGNLPPELAAAASSYWGQILEKRSDEDGARRAWQQAVHIAPQSPAGLDAQRRISQLNY